MFSMLTMLACGAPEPPAEAPEPEAVTLASPSAAPVGAIALRADEVEREIERERMTLQLKILEAKARLARVAEERRQRCSRPAAQRRCR